MTWVKLDDTFADHPKVVAAGDAAAWLYVCGLLYCSRHLTDGFIPHEALDRLNSQRGKPKLAARLIEVVLWHEADGGWTVHDYLGRQSSKETVEKKRADTRERVRKHREKQRAGNSVSSAAETEPEDREQSAEEGQEHRASPSGSAVAKPELVPFEADFNRTWEHYPRKEARKAALKQYQARRRADVDPAELHQATQRYAHVVRTTGRVAMHGATFFGPNDRWKDFLDLDAALAREAKPEAAGQPDPARPALGVVRSCPLEVCDGTGFTDDGAPCRCRGLKAVAT